MVEIRAMTPADYDQVPDLWERTPELGVARTFDSPYPEESGCATQTPRVARFNPCAVPGANAVSAAVAAVLARVPAQSLNVLGGVQWANFCADVTSQVGP